MESSLRLTAQLRFLPGKTSAAHSSLWLPAWVHMRDTGLVMEHLIASWLPAAFRNALPVEWTDAEFRNVCVFLARVHDIGKLTPVFAAKLLPTLPEVSETLSQLGFVIPRGDAFPHGRGSPHALAGQAVLLNAGCPDWTAAVVGAHHGKPVSKMEYVDIRRQLEHYSRNYYGLRGRDSEDADLWRSVRQEWLSVCLEESGLSDLKAVPAPDLPGQMVLTGLLIMADWIASNTRYFPLIPVEEDGSGIDFSERGDTAWKELKLPEPWRLGIRPMDAETFADRFQPDNETAAFVPNPIQLAVIDAVERAAKPGLVILEAQMGAGKTEAALAAAEILASKVGSGGVFFGLPTQATANGIFPRLTEWVRRLLPDLPDESTSIRLAHGAAALNAEYRALFEGSAWTEEDREDADGLVVHPWFEGPKQALLANCVTGTVDQLLLAALKQKHVMLRHLGLCGKVVIVDEVHAYDAYMDQYLFRALQWLGAYRVPVILLSATLPGRLREQLLDAYRNPFTAKPKHSDGEDWRNSLGYPQLTWTDGKEVSVREIALEEPVRVVRLERREDGEIADLLRGALSGGGCAGLIVNTVDRAQTLWEELRYAFPQDRVLLLHARFLGPDRMELEQTLMKHLGKRSTGADRDRLIVVGTQVLEQSLDIDFDLLLTDLCPMDLLLQRIGRLHRHDRARPAPLRQARCVVLQAGDTREEGAAAIYGNWLLERTNALLPETVTLPDSISELVQLTYADPAPELLETPTLRAAWAAQEKRRKEKEDRAKAFLLKRPKGKLIGLLDTSLDLHDERQGEAAVRDGEAALSVIVVVRYGETVCGLVPWRTGGHPAGEEPDLDSDDAVRFSTTRVPDTAACVRIVREQLRLPAAFSRKWMIDRAIAELEQNTDALLHEWRQSRLLNGELFLILDRDLETTLCGYRLRYDRYRGLIDEKDVKEESRGDEGV